MNELYPFRVKAVDGQIVPESPGECEPECLAVPEAETIADAEWLAWHDHAVKHMDERQCRGCGRWGIFTPRAITANLPNGTVIRGPGQAFVRGIDGKWKYLCELLPSIQRPNDGCPCCTRRHDDCWCRTDCGSPRCQMREV